jgi:hypothetical protein
MKDYMNVFLYVIISKWRKIDSNTTWLYLVRLTQHEKYVHEQKTLERFYFFTRAREHKRSHERSHGHEQAKVSKGNETNKNECCIALCSGFAKLHFFIEIIQSNEIDNCKNVYVKQINWIEHDNDGGDNN